MDSSHHLRLKQEAANTYISRSKTVDSSFLTMQRQQKAAYAGSIKKTPLYFNGAPVLRPILYDISSCPINHTFISGYANSEKLSQQESRASQMAGAVLCGEADYSTAPHGMQLLNCSTVSTILTSYNNNTSAPGQWPSYGYGISKYFPKADTPSPSTSCVTNKYPYPSG